METTNSNPNQSVNVLCAANSCRYVQCWISISVGPWSQYWSGFTDREISVSFDSPPSVANVMAKYHYLYALHTMALANLL